MPESSAGKLLQHIRNTAHKFAITTHRTKRSKEMIGSQLEEIVGIGSKRSKVLLEYFGSYKKIGVASFQDLQQVPGINASLAQNIYDKINQ